MASAGDEMTERPILFQSEMVRAYRREVDPKTQTRRMSGLAKINENTDTWGCFSCDPDGRWVFVSATEETQRIRCPYGVAGDRLWTRETWNYVHDMTDAETEATNEILAKFMEGKVHPEAMVDAAMSLPVASGAKRAMYAADFGDWGRSVDSDLKWRPSIHMPRWASRDTLEVLSAVPQRLQDITEADAVAEGILPPDLSAIRPAEIIDGEISANDAIRHFDEAKAAGLKVFRYFDSKQRRCTMFGVRAEYAILWESINGPGSWAKNPWVWKVTFRRLGAESRGMR